jgi:hypothetical protein
LLICLTFAPAILGAIWLYRGRWCGWGESREDAAMRKQESGRNVGHQVFADGVAREVFEVSYGRQYVLDEADERVYGQWLPPADEPHITEAEE